MVENKPGAFGILAIEEMVKAPPDGYTLQVGNAGTNALTPIIYKSKFKFDYDKEVTMVTRLGEIPLILAATTVDFAPKTYAEFIAYAKANPGKVRYASVGVGSNNHYDTEAFAQWAGIKLAAHPEQGRRRRHHQRRAARRRSCRARQRRELGGPGAVRQDPGAGGDGRPAAAGLSQRADAQGTRLHGRQGAVVGALRAVEDAARRARDAAPAGRAGAQRPSAVQSTFKKQMIKAVPNASIADAQAWNKDETAHWKKITETVKIERRGVIVIPGRARSMRTRNPGRH